MLLARRIALLLLLASCHRTVATAPAGWSLADPAPLGGTWRIELWHGSGVPLYDHTPFNTRRPPWVSGTLAFADSSVIERRVRGDTIRGIARLEVRGRPGGASEQLPDYPAVAVLSSDGRIWLRVDLAPWCSERSCSRFLELGGILSDDRLRGDWRYGNDEMHTSGPGRLYRAGARP